MQNKLKNIVLDLKVEDYNIIVSNETRIATCSNQSIEENGFTWAVLLNGVVKVFCTIVYNANTYNAEDVVVNGINWIANKEKTAKQRFAKAILLKSEYLPIIKQQ